MDQVREITDQRAISPGGSDDSRNPETVSIAIEEANDFGKSDEAAKMESEDRCSVVVDLNDVLVEEENQMACRICHLNAKESGKNTIELMELGCGCKCELGVAHSHCAEAWFRIKGDRLCEICGQTASNITGVGDVGFMEEWNERSLIDTGDESTSDGRRQCLHGQPLCNFFMSCLVIAFVLPLFFRVDML